MVLACLGTQQTSLAQNVREDAYHLAFVFNALLYSSLCRFSFASRP